MAQWLEQATHNRWVTGSSPVRRTIGHTLAFVQRIGQDSSKVYMGVRFPHAGPVLSDG